jgi:aryl-alcohol dehydrogenase-like predicted oxidoreductase
VRRACKAKLISLTYHIGAPPDRHIFAVANGLLTQRNLAIADVVRDVAEKMGKTPSQVALAWTLLEPGVTAPIVGARTLARDTTRNVMFGDLKLAIHRKEHPHG